MAYTKTTWVNDTTPAINATNLNKIEQGIYDAHTNLITIVTGTYPVLTTDETVVCNSSSAFTVTLLAATGSGRMQTIKNINTGMVTVSGNGAETIDGDTTINLYQWESAQVVDYASGKWVIA
jgi:hypothetical protein